MWTFTLKRSIDQKIALRKQELDPKEEKGLMGRFTSFAKKFGKNEAEDQQKPTAKVQRSIQQAAYSRIVAYIKYFVTYRLPFEQAR